MKKNRSLHLIFFFISSVVFSSHALDSLPVEGQATIAQWVKMPSYRETLFQRIHNSRVLNLVNKSLWQANNVAPEKTIVPSLKITSSSANECQAFADRYNVNPKAIFALFLTDKDLIKEDKRHYAAMAYQSCIARHILLWEYKTFYPNHTNLAWNFDPTKNFVPLGDKRTAESLKRLFSISTWYGATKENGSKIYRFGIGYIHITNLHQDKYQTLITGLIDNQYVETLQVLLEQKFPTATYGTWGNSTKVWKGVEDAQNALNFQKTSGNQKGIVNQKILIAERILTLFKTHKNYLVTNDFAQVKQNLRHEEPSIAYSKPTFHSVT